MATLVLSAVGTAIGGPIGGSIGSIIGQAVDQRIFGGSGKREGPRLKQLEVQTSSYGNAIPAIFGRMRVAGTVFWATDLVESRNREGGGKGRPATTNYSYAANFAVAVSSRPIARIGRIWADGKLLRGGAGDLKVDTEFRYYSGYGDQPVDPLIASAVGVDQCPAMRGIAYAVFENLQLADYGNRIPQINFEIFEREDDVPLVAICAAASSNLIGGQSAEKISGFAIEGADARSALSPLLSNAPVTLLPDGGGFSIRDLSVEGAGKDCSSIASMNGGPVDRPALAKQRGSAMPRQYILRYYDLARDYQQGHQKSERGGGYAVREEELPVSANAADMKRMADLKLLDLRQQQETLSGHFLPQGQLLEPGDVLHYPDAGGRSYRIVESEYRQGAQRIEARLTGQPFGHAAVAAEAGISVPAADLQAGNSVLEILDLPAIAGHDPDLPLVAVAATGSGDGWRQASLAMRSGDALTELGATAAPATMGRLLHDLPAHGAMLLDQRNFIEVELTGPNNALPTGPGDPQAMDAPLLWINGELLHYGLAQQISARNFRLSGLLRGMLGTDRMIATHLAQTKFVLVEKNSLEQIDVAQRPAGSLLEIEALGIGDEHPVTASRQLQKTALQPIPPCHGEAVWLSNGDLQLRWVRRPRVDAGWNDWVDQPLVEASEHYQITLSQQQATSGLIAVHAPEAQIASAIMQAAGIDPAHPFFANIRQIGNFGQSDGLVIAVPAFA